MRTLRISNVPDELYEDIRRLAATANRSLSAEVVRLLNRRISQKQVLASLRETRFVPRDGDPSTLDLLREDRNG